MKGVRLLLPLLVLALGLAGCSADSRARDWGGQAVERNWQAEYQVHFHQPDQDILLTVREVHADMLSLAVSGPEGLKLVMNYSDGFDVDLNQGQVQWQQEHQEPPYYSLRVLASVLTGADTVEIRDDWIHVGNYRLQLANELPAVVKYLDLWTLEVGSFSWE